jgi:5-methyltetrahydrofolate--homocysteine methyltransferase
VIALWEATGCAIAIDSRDPAIVERALAVYPYKALCNTVTGEPEVLRTMLPVIAQYGAAVGTALVDEQGVPETVEARLAVAGRIVRAAEAHGIPREDVMIDGVCLPSSVMPDTARTTLQTLKALHEELGVPTLLGISNAGYGIPNPTPIDLAYLVAAVSWGLDVAMVNPATPCLAEVVPAIDFLMGTDRYAQRYLRRYRASLTGAGGPHTLN